MCPRQPKKENLPGSAIFNDLQIPESDCRKTCALRSFFFARPQNPTSPHKPHRANAVTHVRGAHAGDLCPRKRNPSPHQPRSGRAPFPTVAKESDRSDRSVRSIPGDPAQAVRGAAADAAVFLDLGPVHRPAFPCLSEQNAPRARYCFSRGETQWRNRPPSSDADLPVLRDAPRAYAKVGTRNESATKRELAAFSVHEHIGERSKPLATTRRTEIILVGFSFSGLYV
jgi:hypothetical protein